jgi:hypothetical protein
MSDYATWRAERLRELDAIDAQIDKLPPILKGLALELTDWIGRSVESPAEYRIAADWHRDQIRQLARELDLITVAPATDAELANEKEGR